MALIDDLSLNNPEIRLLVRILTIKRCQAFWVSPHDWDDVIQNVFLNMLKYTYVERWNSSKGAPFISYLNVFIQNLLSKRWRKQKKERQYRRSFNIIDSEGNVFSLLDLIHDASDFATHNTDLRHDIAQLLGRAETAFSCSTAVVYATRRFVMSIPAGPAEFFYIKRGFFVFQRSVACIFYFLYMGWSQTEIAAFFHVSKPWVSKKVGLLRKFPELLEWAGRS